MVSNTLNIKKVKQGKAERMSFAKHEVPYAMPDLLDIQKDSYKKFLEQDIGEILNEFNPIIDYSNKAELSFLGYSIDKTPKYSWAECKRRGVSYTVPLKVNVRLLVKETGQIMDQEVFMGDVPFMSQDGAFITNGKHQFACTQTVQQTADAAVDARLLGKAGIVLLRAGQRLAVHAEAAGGHAIPGIDDAISVLQHVVAVAADEHLRIKPAAADHRFAIFAQHVLHRRIVLVYGDLRRLLPGEQHVRQDCRQQRRYIVADEGKFHISSGKSKFLIRNS